MKLKKSFLIISVLLSTSLLSQSADSVKNETAFSRKHKWALQFEVGYDFKVNAFNELSFSLKYHLSEKSALRFGVGFYGQKRDENDEQDFIYEFNSFDTKYYNYRLNFVCNYIYYINPHSKFSLYWGLGPTGGFTYYYSEHPNSSNSDNTDKYCSNLWSVGLNGVLGIEWLPVFDFSLFAEYEAEGLYSKSHFYNMVVTKQDHYIEKKEGSYKKLSFESGRALMGISVYFDRLF